MEKDKGLLILNEDICELMQHPAKHSGEVTADGTAGMCDQGVLVLQGMTTEETDSSPSVHPICSFLSVKAPHHSAKTLKPAAGECATLVSPK